MKIHKFTKTPPAGSRAYTENDFEDWSLPGAYDNAEKLPDRAGAIVTMCSQLVECPAPPRFRYPVNGYGRKIPISICINWKGRLRRLYACQTGNAGTVFFELPGKRFVTVSAH